MTKSKEVVKTTRISVKTYDDETVITETKVLEGENVEVSKEITQNKLTKKNFKDAVLVKQVNIIDRRYSDGSKNVSTKEYSYENGVATLTKDLITFDK